MLEALLNALNGIDVVGLMVELAVLPDTVSIGLQKIQRGCYLLTLAIGVEQLLLVTQGAAESPIFIIGNHKYSRLTVLFCLSQKTHSTISKEHDGYSDFILELVALEDTFETRYDSANDSQLNRSHTELQGHEYLDDVSPLLHVELIHDLEIQY